jgi:CheY-like chemotaxis protein
VAHNGLEALHTLYQTCDAPLLVLLHVNMPVMNGVEFLQAYQQHPLAHKSQVVIVVLTTSEHSRELESIHALPGTADILPKPLTREKVGNHPAASFPLAPAGVGNATTSSWL